MSSQQNDGMSYSPSEPKPCANNCGFFGTAGNSNLCSKCYRESITQGETAASAKAAVQKSLLVPFTAAGPYLPPPAADPSPPPSTSADPAPGPDAPPSNRCGCCKKKVGLTGFVCKCGATFCGTHRYPEKHECSFDFKEVGRDEISKHNPVVKADKIQRF